MEPWSGPDNEQAEYWNGPEAAHWLVHEDRYERTLAPFTGLVLDMAAAARSDRVLDIGCGTGSTTCTAARAADGGQVLGMDISAPLLRRAGQRARLDGLRNIRFEHADVQTHRLAPGSLDVAISRFGVMFFSDPTAAFANIARGLHPGGRLVFVCWQNLVDNEWITVPRAAVAQHIRLPPLGDPGSPGPFSLGDRHRLAAVLDAAAFVDVTIESVAVPLWLGRDVADTVEFLEVTGIGQTLLRDVDAPTLKQITRAMQAALAPYLTSDGVWLESRAWLVTARSTR